MVSKIVKRWENSTKFVTENTRKDEIRNREVSQLCHGDREDKASAFTKPILQQDQALNMQSNKAPLS